MTRRPALTLAIPCRTDEPALGRTLMAAWRGLHEAGAEPIETLVCLNGAGPDGCPAERDLEACARAMGTGLVTLDVDATAAPLLPEVGQGGIVALLTRRAGKAIAWNILRRCARSERTIFLDADVELGPGTMQALLGALERAPHAAIASPKTRCAARPNAFERIQAAPYRVDFPNLSGQLYAARTAELPPEMPDDLIEPERWLELAVGRERVVREPAAHVIVRLPATLHDFYRQRIRIEMGKVQLAAEYAALLARGNPQPRAWTALASVGPADAARLSAYWALRASAHAVAWWRYRRRRTEGVWIQAASTKQWSA